MAITITVSNTVTVAVKGTINDAAGIAQPFSFKLVCARLEQEQITAKLKSDDSLIEFMVDQIEDWSGVKDAEGKTVPYSEAAYRQLCKITGVALVSFQCYMAEVGAKAKN